LPIAHGEGKFVPANEIVRKTLWDNDRVALVYARPDGASANREAPFNPNGSIDDIAGICDETGLIFGLMPHPERHLWRFQHPNWTRTGGSSEQGHGLPFFQNSVIHAEQNVGAGL
jgi:phosphoribosylformylglycinamidine (FGAM) synthase-like amidotransferase family enzyme